MPPSFSLMETTLATTPASAPTPAPAAPTTAAAAATTAEAAVAQSSGVGPARVDADAAGPASSPSPSHSPCLPGGLRKCLNVKCGNAISSGGFPGWRLRSGFIAHLCQSCSLLYEQLRFCEVFHFDDSGWRTCNSCKKKVHCGCIASLYAFVLLDTGGIECVDCTRKISNLGMAIDPNRGYASIPVVSKKTPDSPWKIWSTHATAVQHSGTDSRPWRPLPIPSQSQISLPIWNQASEAYKHPEVDRSRDNRLGKMTMATDYSNLCGNPNDRIKPNSGLKLENARAPFEIDRERTHLHSDIPGRGKLAPNSCHGDSDAYFGDSDKQGCEAFPLLSSRKVHEVANERIKTNSGLKLENVRPPFELDRERMHSHSDISGRGKLVPNSSHCDSEVYYGDFEKQGSDALRSLAWKGHEVAMDEAEDLSSSSGIFWARGGGVATVEASENVRDMASLSLATSVAPPMEIEMKEHGKGLALGLIRQRQKLILPKESSSQQTLVPVARPPGEGRGRSPLLPRYWPRITDQELQQIAPGDSNSTVTPLFEKMLSASDAGRIGRLVLPKACAEAYFPPVSNPEGVPLGIRDVSGKDWIFQFRFWPNNNSRMYVLEGVTPCIQSMRLQAGDTVVFSRLDPEGKLIMGYRRAPDLLDSQAIVEGVSEAQMNPTLGKSKGPGNGFHKLEKAVKVKSKENHMEKSVLGGKRKGKAALEGSKSRKGRPEGEDSVAEFKPSWESAQEFLRPPPNVIPTIVIIDGCQFEEYEEPPVFGKRTLCTTGQAGGASNGPQEVESEEINGPLNQNAEINERPSIITEVVASSALETLANVAALGENVKEELSSLNPTTKHPRHRPGCSCIVCIQPPSGKGPKHKSTCTCNVCQTVKRRFQTLMLRRKKRQSEKEAEKGNEEEGEVSSGSGLKLKRENFLFLPNSSPLGTHKLPLAKVEDPAGNKGQIDLNSQPEREEEPRKSAGGRLSMMTLLLNATSPLDKYLKQEGLTSLAFPEPVLVTPLGSSRVLDESSFHQLPAKAMEGLQEEACFGSVQDQGITPIQQSQSIMEPEARLQGSSQS